MLRLEQRQRNTCTHPAFISGLMRSETVYSSAQCVYRRRRKCSTQLCEWSVTIYIQLVAKSVQGFPAFRPRLVTVNSQVDCARRQTLPKGQCRGLEVGRKNSRRIIKISKLIEQWRLGWKNFKTRRVPVKGRPSVDNRAIGPNI